MDDSFEFFFVVWLRKNDVVKHSIWLNPWLLGGVSDGSVNLNTCLVAWANFIQDSQKKAGLSTSDVTNDDGKLAFLNSCIDIFQYMDVFRLVFLFFLWLLFVQMIYFFLCKYLAFSKLILRLACFSQWILSIGDLIHAYFVLLFIFFFLIFLLILKPPIKISSLNLDSKIALSVGLDNVINFDLFSHHIFFDSLDWSVHLDKLWNAIWEQSNWVLKNWKDHDCCKGYLRVHWVTKRNIC